MHVYDFDERAAVIFGEVRSALARSGVRLEDADLFVAAVALSTKSTLVTGNTRHFDRIENLRIENWMT